MSLNKNLEFLFNDPGPHEATFGCLESLVQNNPELLEVLKDKFRLEENSSHKEDIAMIISRFDTSCFYKSYLIENHDWEESDFE